MTCFDDALPSAYGLQLASQPLEQLGLFGLWWAKGVIDLLRQQSGSYPEAVEDGAPGELWEWATPAPSAT